LPNYQRIFEAVGLVRWNTDDNIVKVVQEILNYGRITYEEYFNIIGDTEKAEKILHGNVFTAKKVGVETVIYFQNIATRNYFARMIAELDQKKAKLVSDQEKAKLESKKRGWLW
jgi:tetrahydromethanopterin S-methyltransferase subunit A